jgi:hypothetical protein
MASRTRPPPDQMAFSAARRYCIAAKAAMTLIIYERCLQTKSFRASDVYDAAARRVDGVALMPLYQLISAITMITPETPVIPMMRFEFL